VTLASHKKKKKKKKKKMRRRVVVTGLGAVTPLGIGARQTWTRLIAGRTGIRSVLSREPASQWAGIPSTVAGLVPHPHTFGSSDDATPAGARDVWHASDWVGESQQRRMSLFTQYAVAAAEMALDDAGWRPSSELERENTGVCLGTGIGNLDEMYDTSVAFAKGV
jgi:3-oxoacyl-[acyl-carrier-protein] synthase II